MNWRGLLIYVTMITAVAAIFMTIFNPFFEDGELAKKTAYVAVVGLVLGGVLVVTS